MPIINERSAITMPNLTTSRIGLSEFARIISSARRKSFFQLYEGAPAKRSRCKTVIYFLLKPTHLIIVGK
jgi:hypothetical protein